MAGPYEPFYVLVKGGPPEAISKYASHREEPFVPQIVVGHMNHCEALLRF